MKTIKKTLPKQKDHAFKKDVYLLGTDKDGIKYWLESPTWDCGRYWGFGYVETYHSNRVPSKAKDINSHSHVSGLVGKQEAYDFEKGCFVPGEYIHNIYDNATLDSTTFTEAEGWTLSELFQTFYHLRETAEVLSRGGSHLTSNPLADLIKNGTEVKRINEIVIPALTEKILQILSPVNEPVAA